MKCAGKLLGPVLLIVAACLALPVHALVTGNLLVEVRDEEGEPLPGATVEVWGNAQPGTRAETADAGGTVRFNYVPPGDYSIRVSMPGYGTVVRDETRVKVDETRHAVIRLSSEIVEEVKVVAEQPLVNVRTTKVGPILERELVDAVPTQREWWDQLFLVAGVGNEFNPTTHGGRTTDNLYLMDGINITGPVSGTLATAFSYEIVDYHEITTAGQMAEYGSVVGMTSNVITKSGGNEFHGSFNVFRLDQNWYSATEPDAIGSSRQNGWDSSFNIGGPIVKDRLWFFTSYQKLRTETETLVPEGSASRPDQVWYTDRIFAKLSWQIAPRHDLVVQLNLTDGVLDNLGAENVLLDRDQFSTFDQPTTNLALRYTAVLGPRLMLQSQISTHKMNIDEYPQFPESGPNTRATGTVQQFGRYGTEYFSTRDRIEFRTDLTQALSSGWGQHNLKFGVQYHDTDFQSLSVVSGGERFVERQSAGSSLWSIYGPGNGLLFRWDALEAHNAGWQCMLGGVPCSDQTGEASSFTDPADWQLIIDGNSYTPTDVVFDDPSANSDAAGLGWSRFMRQTTTDVGDVGLVGQKKYALYAQDEWTWNRWTTLLGLRAERIKLEDSRGEHLFTYDTTLAPRVGLIYDLFGNGRQKVYAHYGRYYDPVRDNYSAFAGQLGAPVTETQYWFDPLQDYCTWSSAGGPGNPWAVIAPVMETPYTDDFIVGWATALGRRNSLEITLLKRRTKNIADDFDPIFGLGDPDIYPTLQSGPTLEQLGFTDRNGDGVVDMDDIDGRYVIYNVPGAVRDFKGVDVIFRREFANRWQMLASYSYADATGNMWSDSRLLYYVGDDPYWDPRLPYNYGKIDIPDHTFKAFGSYRFPFGFEIGASFWWLSGTHYGLSAIVTPDQGWGYWDGDPAKIVDTLSIDRSAFETELGIPATLPDGSRNPELDQAITELVPLDLRVGRGAYENPSWYQLDLRLRYRFKIYKGLLGDVFFDVINVFDRQKTTVVNRALFTEPGVDVTPDNISDRSIYLFQQPEDSQSPRSYFAGIRFTF